MKKAILGIILAIIIALSLSPGAVLAYDPNAIAIGGGITTATFTIDTQGAGKSVYRYYSSGELWPVITSSNGTGVGGSGADYTGYNCSANADKFTYCQFGIASWDTISLPSDAVITSAKIVLVLDTETATGSGSMKINLCVYQGFPAVPTAITPNDYQERHTFAYKVFRLSQAVNFDDITAPGTNLTFDLNSAGIALINKSGYSSFAFRWTLEAESSTPWYTYIGYSKIWYYLYSATAAQRAKLVVQYTSASSPRIADLPTNAAPTAGIGGAITSIDWQTPRTAYSDENLGFKVVGAVNEGIDLELQGVTGQVLKSYSDVIRSDGFYYWLASYTGTYRGFARVKETGSGIYSHWGYIASAPDSTQVLNGAYTKYTKFPQTDIPLKSYVCKDTELLFFSWKTDIVDTFGDYQLILTQAAHGTAYSQKLDWLITNYLEIGYANNENMAGWRYVIAVLNGDDVDPRDGLVINLARPYSWENAGLYIPQIISSVIGEYTETVSGYWYLDNVVWDFSLDKKAYKALDPMVASVSAMAEIREVFSKVKIELVAPGKTVAATYDNNSLASQETKVSMNAPADKANYIARFYFYGSVVSFQYVQDINFAVNTTGTGAASTTGGFSLWDWLKTDAGHWALMLIAMIVFGGMFWKNKIVAAAVVLGILGLAIVIGWVDVWLVVLLALGAGLAIFFILRR